MTTGIGNWYFCHPFFVVDYLWAFSEIIAREGSVAAEVADDNDWELRFEWKREGVEIRGLMDVETGSMDP